MKLTLGEGAEALGLLAWLATNQGRESIIPLPHLCRRVTAAAARMDTALFIDSRDELFMSALQEADVGSTGFGFQALGQQDGMVLIVDPINGWQTLRVNAGASPDELFCYEPLARPVSARSRIYPALRGVIRQATRAEQHTDRLVDVVLDMDVAPPAWDYAVDYGYTPPYETIHRGTVGMDWGDTRDMEFDSALEQLDTVAAPVWSHRISDRNPQTLQRRFLTHGKANIIELRGLIDWLRGRQKSIWVDEQVTGIELAEAVLPDADRLIVSRFDLPAWQGLAGSNLWLRTAAEGIVELRVAGIASRDVDTAELLLAEPLAVGAPIDPADPSLLITRRLRCRLNHDAVDLIWHTSHLLEVNLTFKVLPDETSTGQVIELIG